MGSAGLQREGWEIRVFYEPIRASQMVIVVKNLPANEGNIRDAGSIPVGKMPWRRARQPTPVFLPGESHGQRSLAGSWLEASGVPCLNPRRGLTLLSPVCRDPAIGV